MKYMKQFGIILLVTYIGEALRFYIPLSIPASIYGLCLMLVLLITKVIKVDQVKEAGDFLIEIMPLMFIPAAVGLITSWMLLKTIWVPVLVITIMSTLLVMVAAGKVTQCVLQKRRK